MSVTFSAGEGCALYGEAELGLDFHSHNYTSTYMEILGRRAISAGQHVKIDFLM